jgi:hypothetical protein
MISKDLGEDIQHSPWVLIHGVEAL